jgi:hypothetical protein
VLVPENESGGVVNYPIQTAQSFVRDVHHRFCTVIQRADEYGYSWTKMTLGRKEDAGTALSLPGLQPAKA